MRSLAFIALLTIAELLSARSSNHHLRQHDYSYCDLCARDQRGRIKRNPAARRAFKQEHPCPATNSSVGPCLGYVIDHVKPLVCGGKDAPANMQWQTREAAKEKDRWEREACQ